MEENAKRQTHLPQPQGKIKKQLETKWKAGTWRRTPNAKPAYPNRKEKLKSSLKRSGKRVHGGERQTPNPLTPTARKN